MLVFNSFIEKSKIKLISNYIFGLFKGYEGYMHPICPLKLNIFLVSLLGF